MKYKIVLVPFPFDDFSAAKVRPAICLTNYIGNYDHIVIAFISTKIPTEPLETDIIIKKGSVGFKQTGLIISSVIRIHKLVTIPKSIIKRELGQLDEVLQKEVEQKIKKLFNSI
ncbi:MAG: type II toxin-antitoxin system PemK/MazF family toxin [Bacteroidetes bacterium]|nr:type II toxin-antitoxin system PemK/MazF family toxin [Bacteroidota bacterium]MBL7104816.1 type II toxin-antitoxin system PemK/MazF family toxin [Bacteroidales bacterium]